MLFGKLENMPHNSLYVNFLLTGLVAQLACYPQPLLRSFLLNTNMVFQPSVKSLLQVWPPGNPCPHGVMGKCWKKSPRPPSSPVLPSPPLPCPGTWLYPPLDPLWLLGTLCSRECPILWSPVPEGTPPVVLQVLGSVKNKIESFAATQEDFPALLFKAKKYLIARGRLDWAEGPGAVPALRRTDTLGEDMAWLGAGGCQAHGVAHGAGGCCCVG